MEKFVAVLIDFEQSPYMDYPLGSEGELSRDVVASKVGSLGVPVYMYSSVKDIGTRFQGDLYSLLQAIDKSIPDFDHLVIFHSHAPLLDLGLTREMIEAHLESIADYTFAEHYPQGFAPFIINKTTFKKILLTVQGNNTVYHAKAMEDILHMDLNAYDVEMVVSDEDLRFIRDSFFVDSKRHFLLVQALFDKKVGANQLLEAVNTEPPLLRPLPTFIELELSRLSEQTRKNWPDCSAEEFLSFGLFQKLMDDLKPWAEESVIELGGYGEPLQNPEIEKILSSLNLYENFTFILKTNGALFHQYRNLAGKAVNLKVVFTLDAPSAELHKELRGSDDFDQVEENIELFLKTHPRRGYIQITRMKSNEEMLEGFLNRWRAFQDNIIIEKYNDFSGAFADEKVVNLAPLKRFPCWKLQREVFIHADGKISLCSQDFDKKNIIGDINQEALSVVWDKAGVLYSAHWKENYPRLCEDCDQWYIFSF